MAYVTITEFDAYCRDELGSTDIATRQQALDAAHQLIDDVCQRKFVVAGSGSARVYVPNGSDVLRIHDCTTVTAVTENSTTVTSTDYQLEPLNNLSWSGATVPYEQIRRLSGYWYRDGMKATISVTATWGWSAIPEPIVQACLILAKDIAMHRDVRFGLAGISDYGGVRARQAAIIADLVASYKRVEAWGIA